MAKKITQDQVVEKNLWQNTIDSTKALIEVVDLLNKELSQTTKITKEALSKNKANNFEGLKEANADVEKLNKAFESKLKIDKQRTTLQNKLNAIEDETSKNLSELEVKTKKLSAAKNDLIKRQLKSDKQRRLGNEEIAEAIKLTKAEEIELSKLTQELTVANLRKAESTKINKDQIKEAIGLTDEYQKQSKRLNTLRKEFKNLLLIEGKATKETKRLEKEVNDLDKTLKDVDEAAGQFQRNVGNYPGTLQEASSSLLGFAAAALGAKLSLDGLQEALENTEEGSESLRETTSGLSGIWDQTSNAASSFISDIVDLGKGLSTGDVNALGLVKSLGLAAVGMSELDKSATSLDKSFARTNEATTDFVAKAEASAKAAIELERRTIAFEKAIRPLEKRLTVLNGLIEQQQIIAGDSTRSFNDLQAAIFKGQSLQVERANLNVRIANEELEISRELIRIKELAGGAGKDLRDAETAAVNKLIDAENELKNEVLENEKEIRQIKQDRLEIDLDILIDGFDNQKTINERIIANEKETLEVRSALLKKTGQLAEDSFRGQKDVLQELSAAGLDVDELLLLDATELAKQIQLLEQSEIINTRTLEVIRERRIVIQDLEDAQNDLNESEQSSIDIRKDIIAQEEALFVAITGNAKETKEALENLEKTREQDNIDNLIRRLDLEKDGSVEFLSIQKELNDALLDQQNERIEKEEENEKKTLDNQINNRKKVLSVLQALNDKFFADKLKKADEEIDSTEKRGEQLQNLAAQGNADAAASLGQNQKDQAEANRKKEELLQKEKQFELALAVISAFNSELDNGKTTGQALTSAITSTTVLTSFVASLPSFLDGTTDTGNKGSLDSNGGHLAMLHENERVVDKGNNAKFGGISNDDAANIVHDFNNDLLSYNTPQLTIKENRFDSNEQILSKFDTLEKSIVSAINNKETYLGSDIDTIKKMIFQNYSKDGTKTKVKSKFTTRK